MSENALCAPEEYAERDIAMTLMPDAYAAFNDHSGIERTCADDGELFTERAYADVHLTQMIEDAWMARDLSGDYNDITFTFIGTASGAFRMYPGAQLARAYNPTIRPWYFQATAFKDRYAVTTPYIDATGTGVLTSMAVPIFEGAPSCNDSLAIGHDAGCACARGADCASGVCRGGACTAERVEAVVSMSYKYAGFHSKMLKITQAAADAATGRACDADAVYDDEWDGSAVRCYLFDGSTYLAWAPQFATASLGDTSAYQMVPLAKHEGLVNQRLEEQGVLVRHAQRLYQGQCTKTPEYLDKVDTTDGLFLTAQEQDENYAGSKTTGYFPPWANSEGCVQEIVYYEVNETALLADYGGLLKGTTSGACSVADYTLAAVNGTNLYLLIVDVTTDVERATDAAYGDGLFNFGCAIENHLRVPGAYRLSNGSCPTLDPPEYETGATCPEVLGYDWR